MIHIDWNVVCMISTLPVTKTIVKLLVSIHVISTLLQLLLPKTFKMTLSGHKVLRQDLARNANIQELARNYGKDFNIGVFTDSSHLTSATTTVAILQLINMTQLVT